jgi:hypothetical protein
MSSAGALLVGTPAKINPDLLSGSGVLVDSVNGLHGDVLLAAGSGMSVATNAGTNTVTYANAGVTSAVAGTGITVSGATGDVTITRQPGFVRYATATALIGVSPAYPELPDGTPFGAGFTPTTTGFYAVNFSYETGSNSKIFGPGDVLNVGLRANGVITTDYVNWVNLSEPSGLEDVYSQTLLVQMTAGVVYDFYWWAQNFSETLDLGGGSINAVIYAP